MHVLLSGRGPESHVRIMIDMLDEKVIYCKLDGKIRWTMCRKVNWKKIPFVSIFLKIPFSQLVASKLPN